MCFYCKVMSCFYINLSQLDDSIQIGTLAPAGSSHVCVTLEGRGLKGGGKKKPDVPVIVHC